MSTVSCGHNDARQTLVPGRSVPCRKCGMLIEPEAAAVNANNEVGQASRIAPAVNKYPGGHNG